MNEMKWMGWDGWDEGNGMRDRVEDMGWDRMGKIGRDMI